MLTERHRILIESVKRLIRRNATVNLSKIVNKTHAADLSIVFTYLSIPHQRKLFYLIENIEQKGILLSELAEFKEDCFLSFVETFSIDEDVEILEHMATDDVADLLSRLPKEKSDAILEKMKTDCSNEVEDLLRYEVDTAGSIMVTDFIALKQDTTAREAIESLQNEHVDVEMPFYLYVVDDTHRLVGVCSLRQLVVVKPNTPLKDFMTKDIFSVQTNMDQEEVAKIVARYDILAVPVVDENNVLMGIITVDDILDIIRKEATEDILKMAGAGEEFVETQSVFRSTRIRLPWLFASCLGGIIACGIISHFGTSLTKFVYLAAFIPVITGMGGNIGTQSSTVVVRGLATGRFHPKDLLSVVSKELFIGLVLGTVYGFLISIVAQVKFSRIPFSFSVGVALLASMSIAAVVGSLVPMLFARIHIDPAVATGPFVTTSVDVLSILVYFHIATLLMSI
ncbi:MAG: magnesium transporter [Desulfobacterales bacterium]|nr:magnesium transporter [Desulfobacterales bacterium]